MILSKILLGLSISKSSSKKSKTFKSQKLKVNFLLSALKIQLFKS